MVTERRIWVVGTSGAGKTRTAGEIAERLGVPRLELDSLRHQAGWTELPDEEFRAQVGEFVAQSSWVVDGNYNTPLGRTVVDRTTEVVWLDPPRWRLMAQVTWRSVSRSLIRAELWNGNRESFAAWLDPGHPVRWAWTTGPTRVAKYTERAAQSEIPWHRLRTRRAVRRYVGSLSPVERP